MLPERREVNYMQDIVKLVIPTVIVGIASAALTVQISVAVIRAELEAMQSNMTDIKLVLNVVQENQLATARLNIITDTTTSDVLKLWTEVSSIRGENYTKEDARRDIEMLRLEHKTLVF